jgi:hypothetical protein
MDIDMRSRGLKPTATIKCRYATSAMSRSDK